jgi:GMP synthase-like glutamine amidotransferase
MKMDGLPRASGVCAAGGRGDRLPAHGFCLRTLRSPALAEPEPDTDAVAELVLRADLVLLLGSADAVHQTSRASAVEAEAVAVRRALAGGVPVLGICYGAQLAAHALGGTVRPAERGEVGWMPVASLDDELCGTGPWLHFHADVLTAPPRARLTG